MPNHDEHEPNIATATEFFDGQRLLDALADDTRRSIFNLLLDQPKPVKAISADLPISQPAVSQHLKVMREAGLVSKAQQGRYAFYGVNPIALNWLSVQFGSLRDDVLGSNGLCEDSDSIAANDKDLVDTVMDEWAATGTNHDLLATSVVVRMFLVVQHIKSLTERACAPFGIGFPERHLLNILSRQKSRAATLVQLASGGLLPLTATARHLNRLEQLKLVTLTDNDKTARIISITPKGIETLRMIGESERHNEFSTIYSTPTKDLKQLETLLRPLAQGLHETLKQDK